MRSGSVGEELHEGDHDAEAINDGFVESRGSGEGGSKLDVKDVVLEAQEIGGRTGSYKQLTPPASELVAGVVGWRCV